MSFFHEIYVLLRLAGIHFFGLFGRAGVEVLIEGLNESDERIVKLAEDKLRYMGSKATASLIKALNSKNTLIQSRTAKLLGNMGPEVVSSLSQAMNSKDIFVRLEAISALGLVGQKTQTAIPHLIDALIDPSVRIRKKTKKAIKHIGCPAKLGLLKALKSAVKADKYHAYKIAETLSGFGENAVPELIEILKTGHKSEQPFAMYALRFMGKDVLPTIIDLLKHKHSHVRSSAAKICEMMIYKAKEAIPALTGALTDENDDVRFRAAMALGIVGGDPSLFIPVLEELTISLDKYDCYALYHNNHKYYRVQITDEDPIIGEVGWDRRGLGFLAPEKDDRGGGMGSILLVGKFFRSDKGETGDLTRVSGFFEKGVGILVTNMAPDVESSDRAF
jgi:HEAT repeat protein